MNRLLSNNDILYVDIDGFDNGDVIDGLDFVRLAFACSCRSSAAELWHCDLAPATSPSLIGKCQRQVGGPCSLMVLAVMPLCCYCSSRFQHFICTLLRGMSSLLCKQCAPSIRLRSPCCDESGTLHFISVIVSTHSDLLERAWKTTYSTTEGTKAKMGTMAQ